MRAQRGFTLLEMLVAIGIAAMVMGLSAPSTMKLYNTMQYQGAVRDVMSTLVAGRYAAVTSGEAQDVLIQPKSRVLTVKERTRQLPDSVALEVESARELNRNDSAVIRFYPDGSSSGGRVFVGQPGGRASQVQVDWLLGRVELCKNDCERAL